jgi:hypothetical protein
VAGSETVASEHCFFPLLFSLLERTHTGGPASTRGGFTQAHRATLVRVATFVEYTGIPASTADGFNDWPRREAA